MCGPTRKVERTVDDAHRATSHAPVRRRTRLESSPHRRPRLIYGGEMKCADRPPLWRGFDPPTHRKRKRSLPTRRAQKEGTHHAHHHHQPHGDDEKGLGSLPKRQCQSTREPHTHVVGRAPKDILQAPSGTGRAATRESSALTMHRSPGRAPTNNSLDDDGSGAQMSKCDTKKRENDAGLS